MNAIENYKRSRQRLFDVHDIQPHSRVVVTDGPVKRVHYLEIGMGSPLVLVHGGGSHSSEWINILKPLSAHYRVYAVDRPGCGLTDNFDYTGVNVQKNAVEFIESFMDALELEKALFVAQSMGGYFSICFALKCPERVEKLLLIGAPAGMNLWIPPVLRFLGTKGLNRLLVKSLAKPSVRNVKNVHKQLLVADIEKLSDTYLEHCYHGQLLPGSELGFLTLLENVLTLRGWKKDLYVGDKLHQLKMPVRFIWGDKDAFEKPDTGGAKTSGIRDCRFEVVRDAGHCPWLDQPEKCVALIRDML
ncbi:pimeloyl-ACP methyl ester carboxylesterase [Lewinella aquimaris]|uniref:Pimeloyl-ACP methyl ester carboxylesterase n=1 Tax=Neolewinella aquimaris TaxID=1835722 RepID=A0A840EAV9_9BACT|nr:alpha/beta hydrolase [Neolewinella aquimaris]MBB4080577.1 pimeloyl-ACP methyl ester carboxylesterase [Neolewinella aquimaris]